MAGFPAQLWINLFRNASTGDFSVEACHLRIADAYEEISDWRDGFAWRGYEYAGTLYSCRPIGPIRNADERERGEIDLSKTMAEWLCRRREGAC